MSFKCAGSCSLCFQPLFQTTSASIFSSNSQSESLCSPKCWTMPPTKHSLAVHQDTFGTPGHMHRFILKPRPVRRPLSGFELSLTLLLLWPLRCSADITHYISHWDTLLWVTLGSPGHFEHTRRVWLKTLPVALCRSSTCKFDLFCEYCNWAERHFMSFILTLICYRICRFWRSNWEQRREGRERKSAGGGLFHQLSLKSCVVPHELKGMRLHQGNDWLR